jgi:hypothetical protein
MNKELALSLLNSKHAYLTLKGKQMLEDILKKMSDEEKK